MSDIKIEMHVNDAGMHVLWDNIKNPLSVTFGQVKPGDRVIPLYINGSFVANTISSEPLAPNTNYEITFGKARPFTRTIHVPRAPGFWSRVWGNPA